MSFRERYSFGVSDFRSVYGPSVINIVDKYSKYEYLKEFLKGISFSKKIEPEPRITETCVKRRIK